MSKGLYQVHCLSCKFIGDADGDLREFLVLKDLMDDGNEDFDINFEVNYYLRIERVSLHKFFEKYIKNKSDICSIGAENLYKEKIDSPFIKDINCVIYLEDGKFAASSSNMILVFDLENNKVNYLIMKKVGNDNLLTLCYFKLRNLNAIASGGNVLSLFEINYTENNFNLFFGSAFNKKITKIIFIEEKNRQAIERLTVCDQKGYIGLYDIKNNSNISFLFRQKCHDSKINCILYIPNEKVLVSRGDNNLRFWSIEAFELK